MAFILILLVSDYASMKDLALILNVPSWPLDYWLTAPVYRSGVPAKNRFFLRSRSIVKLRKDLSLSALSRARGCATFHRRSGLFNKAKGK